MVKTSAKTARAEFPLSFDPIVDITAILAAAGQIALIRGLSDFVVARIDLVRVRGTTHIRRGIDLSGTVAARLHSR